MADKSTLEQSLTELEKLVNEIETGEIGLEASIQKFRQGLEIAKTVKNELKRIETEVQVLNQEFNDLSKDSSDA